MFPSGRSSGYLFVDEKSGFLVPVWPLENEGSSQCLGYGVWYHDLGDFEIATALMTANGHSRWHLEYYRIHNDWMHWSNRVRNIFHDRVEESDVPDQYLSERQRIVRRMAYLQRPDFDPSDLTGA